MEARLPLGISSYASYIKKRLFLCEFWDICGTSTIVTNTHVANTPKNDYFALVHNKKVASKQLALKCKSCGPAA